MVVCWKAQSPENKEKNLDDDNEPFLREIQQARFGEFADVTISWWVSHEREPQKHAHICTMTCRICEKKLTEMKEKWLKNEKRLEMSATDRYFGITQ